MIHRLLVALILLLGTCGLVEAQDRSGQSRSRDPGPIQMLLERRADLGLTAEQVVRLEEIDAGMDERNQPLVSRLSEIRHRIRALRPFDDMTPENRALFDSYVAEARPLLDQIEENNWAAMKLVGEVLTDAQKEQIERFIRERADNRERSGRSSRDPSHGN